MDYMATQIKDNMFEYLEAMSNVYKEKGDLEQALEMVEVIREMKKEM